MSSAPSFNCRRTITRFVEENYGKLRNRNTRARRVDSGSYFAGETKGRTIQINRPLPQ